MHDLLVIVLSLNFFQHFVERCLKGIRAVMADLIKWATKTEGSGAENGLGVTAEEKSMICCI